MYGLRFKRLGSKISFTTRPSIVRYKKFPPSFRFCDIVLISDPNNSGDSKKKDKLNIILIVSAGPDNHSVAVCVIKSVFSPPVSKILTLETKGVKDNLDLNS